MKRIIGSLSLILGWGLFLAGIVKAVLVKMFSVGSVELTQWFLLISFGCLMVHSYMIANKDYRASDEEVHVAFGALLILLCAF
jgi:hypothetical protein